MTKLAFYQCLLFCLGTALGVICTFVLGFTFGFWAPCVNGADFFGLCGCHIFELFGCAFVSATYVNTLL